MQITQDTYLKMATESLDDIERVRIAMENRYRSMTQSGISEDGHAWGLGIDPSEKAPQEYLKLVLQIQDLEQKMIKAVQKEMKNSPLGPFVKQAQGVGEKQAARLLAAVGDPYWHSRDERPRTVGELWAYCGLDVRNGSAPRRQKGSQSNWNEEARKRAWLIAKSIEKQTKGKYREIYDSTKEHYAEATHAVECVRCTGVGKPPAPVGSPLKPAHIQSRALRKVAKEVLKDMYLASKEVHEKA